MVEARDITIDEKNGRFYIIMHSDEIEFRSNDLDLAKAIAIRDRMIAGSQRHGVPRMTVINPDQIPNELKQFFRL